MNPQPNTPLNRTWQAEVRQVAARNPRLAQQIWQNRQAYFERYAYYFRQLADLPRKFRRKFLRRLGTTLAGLALLLAAQLAGHGLVLAEDVHRQPGGEEAVHRFGRVGQRGARAPQGQQLLDELVVVGNVRITVADIDAPALHQLLFIVEVVSGVFGQAMEERLQFLFGEFALQQLLAELVGYRDQFLVLAIDQGDAGFKAGVPDKCIHFHPLRPAAEFAASGLGLARAAMADPARHVGQGRRCISVFPGTPGRVRPSRPAPN